MPDVEQFPEHIAYSNESKSEIVIPSRRDGRIIAALDIDREKPASFEETDRKHPKETINSYAENS